MSVLSVILGLMGGLGLFLYGMELMSKSLEKAAGAKMRSVLEFFTSNRFMGMLVGVIFTAVIQSSSATTVMVVSFVNSGLMNLMQAAGVIMGANIGTTVTAQILRLGGLSGDNLFLLLLHKLVHHPVIIGHFLAHPITVQMIAHPHEYFHIIKRLGDIIHRACLKGLLFLHAGI